MILCKVAFRDAETDVSLPFFYKLLHSFQIRIKLYILDEKVIQEGFKPKFYNLHLDQGFRVKMNFTFVYLSQMSHFTIKQIVWWDFDDQALSLLIIFIIHLKFCK